MALTLPYKQKNYMGEHANDGACLTFIQSCRWDSLGTGLGTPQNGQWYYSTTLGLFRGYLAGAWTSFPTVAAAQDSWSYAAGRNVISSGVYLNGAGGVPTNVAGFVVPWDAIIIGIGAATNANETWIAEIRKNNAAAVIDSLSIAAASTGYKTSSVNTNVGDEIQVYCNGTGISRPQTVVYMRRR
jgi:uncharacterized transporter YbjL